MTMTFNKPQQRRGQPQRKTSNTSTTLPSVTPTTPTTVPPLEHQEFTILKTLHSDQFSKIYLARPDTLKKSFDQSLVLKSFSSDLTSFEDFTYELELNYFLSPHPNILTSYNIPFTWNSSFIYPQEHAPYGNLWKFIRKPDGTPTPLPESQVKSITQQLSLALEFTHGLNLVHRDVVPENVLVFQRDLSLVKLSDFGSMVPSRSLLTKSSSDILVLKTEKEEVNKEPPSSDVSPKTRPKGGNATQSASIQGCGKLAYLPPEFCGILPQEKYHVYPSFDVWQVGILIFSCLTGGATPWKSADVLKDQGYNHYCDWLKRKSLKSPGAFLPFSGRLMRLLKRMLEPKPSKRCRIQETAKYLKDDWIEMKKGIASTSVINLSGIGGMIKSPSSVNVIRSNSDSKDQQGQGQKCPFKRSMTVTNKRKTEKVNKPVNKRCGTTSNGREPVFKICCAFQNFHCKSQNPQHKPVKAQTSINNTTTTTQNQPLHNLHSKAMAEQKF